MPGYQDSLNTIQTIVGDPAAFRGGKPQWKTVEEMDRFLTGKGFRLSDAQVMGPKGKADGQQLIYDGPNNVIVKVKTRGYSNGGPPQRVGVATMSIEATDGKGTGWDNVLFKVDSNGKVLAKSITATNEEIVRLPADHKARIAAKQAGQPEPEWGVKNPRDGSVRAFSKFELIEGGANPKPINKQAWADASHMNLPEEFNPAGADALAAKIKGGTPPTGGGGPPPPPPPPRPRISTTIKGIGKFVGAAAITVFLGFAMSWMKRKLGIDDETLIKKQIQDILDYEVTPQLNKKKFIIASMRVGGGKPYANVTVVLINQTIIDPETRIHISPTPAVAFEKVEISEKDINETGKLHAWGAGDTIFRENPYTFSFEITLPDADLEWYRRFRDKYDQVYDQLKNPRLTNDQRRDLEQQKQAMMAELDRWNDQN